MFTLPEKTPAPYQDDTPSISTTGWFETSIWHGEAFEEQKAFLSLLLWTDNDLDAEHTIQAQYGLDGAVATTTTLGTINTGSTRIHELFFNDVTTPETNAVGRTIQFRFTLASDDTVSPKLYGFALHSMLHPERLRMWEAYVWVDGYQHGNMTHTPASKASILSSLSSLETQVFPIYMTHDLDGDGTVEALRVKIVDWERVPEGSEKFGGREPAEVYRIVFQEIRTA